jgi:hypothetical protein
MKSLSRNPVLTLAAFAFGLCSFHLVNAQTLRNTPLRNARSTVATASRRETTTAQTRPNVTIRQTTERQLIQNRNNQLLRQQGLSRIPDPQKPLQWRNYYQSMDRAKKEVMGPRYTPPSRGERFIRGIGTGLGLINSLPNKRK